MMRVGRFLGVPIYFAPSWLIIAALLTLYYAPIVDDIVDGGVSASTAYLVAFGYAVLFALCVLAHELGHTATSIALGNPVRRVVIFVLGGVSEIERDPQRPRDEFLVAAAGPAVSIVLAGVAAAILQVVREHTIAGALVWLLMWSNIVVAIFNLLPGLPLDGGRLLRAGVWAGAGSRIAGTRAGAWVGRGLAIAIVVVGLWLDRTSFGLGTALFSFALAAYLWFGANQALRVGEMLDRLPDVSLRELLRPGLMVRSDVSVAEALRRVREGSARGLVLVDGSERPQAIVDEQLISLVPPERQAWTPVTEVARPLEPGLVLNVGLAGEDLLAAVRSTPAHEYLVVDDRGAPAGILSVVDLAASLRGPA